MYYRKTNFHMSKLLKVIFLIIMLLCFAGCKKSTSQLIEELKSNDINVNAKAEEELVAKGEEAFPLLMEELKNFKTKEQRNNIAKALGKFIKPEAVKPLLISVQNDLEDEEYKNIVKNSIREIGVDSAKIVINNFYKDEDSCFKKLLDELGLDETVFDASGINWSIIYERTKLNTATGGTVYEELTQKGSNYNKLYNYMEEVLAGIYEVNSEEYVKLFRDNDPLIRNTAMYGLAKADINKSMKTVSDIISSNDKELKNQAIIILGIIKNEEALNILMQLADEKDSELRKSIIFALGEYSEDFNALDTMLAMYSSADSDEASIIEGYLNKILEKVPQAKIDKLLSIKDFKKADKGAYKLGKAIVINKDTKKLNAELYIKMPGENRISLNNISELDSLVLLELGDYIVGYYMNGIKACVKTCTVTVINFKNKKILGSKKFDGGQPPVILNYFENNKPEKGFGTDPDNGEILKYILSFR